MKQSTANVAIRCGSGAGGQRHPGTVPAVAVPTIRAPEGAARRVAEPDGTGRLAPGRKVPRRHLKAERQMPRRDNPTRHFCGAIMWGFTRLASDER